MITGAEGQHVLARAETSGVWCLVSVLTPSQVYVHDTLCCTAACLLTISNHRPVVVVAGLYGTLFRRNKEAAFSNYRLWESAGFVVAYAYSNHLCARMKLYVMFVVLCIGMVGYIIVEILHKKKKQRQKKLAEDPKAAEVAAAEAKANNVVEETDDEKDDIDDELVITHL